MKNAPIKNAWLDDGLTLRVGVPQFNGALPAHCSENDTPVMVSAGAFWRPRKRAFAEPTRWGWSTDGCNVALDSAGFVAMKHWAGQGGQPGMESIYPWSLAQYMNLVLEVLPRWWSQPDACCEPEIAGSPEIVHQRLRMTERLLGASLLAAIHWLMSDRTLRHHFGPPVPVIQGWTKDQYRQSLRNALSMWKLYTNGTPVERVPTLIGIGSVCRRDLRHPEHGLWAVLDAVGDVLPKGSKVHLFGVKGEAMAELRHFPFVASVDSMAWDFSARVDARARRISNTNAHRIGHLERWRDRQLGRIDCPQSDLFARHA